MPTAAKLVAAIAFAAVAFFAAEMFKGTQPADTGFGWFTEICAALGVICGWLVMGRLAGQGYRAAMGYGVRTSVTITFWALLLFSGYEMVIRSTKLRYDGPMEALTAVVDLMLERGRWMATPEVLGTLFVGGILGGLLVEWAGKQWR